MRKLITLFTALTVGLGLSFVLTAPAQSADRTGTTFSNADSASVARVMRKRRARSVTIKFTVTNHGKRFRFNGAVKPCGKRAKVHLQHKRHKHGHWRNFRKKRTNRHRHYAFKHLHTVGFFRVTAPKTHRCKFGHSKTIKVIRR